MPIVLLQVNTVVSRQIDSVEERLENNVLLIERSARRITFLVCIFPTLYLYFVDARDAETRRAWHQQQANPNAVAEAAALQARHEETTRLAGERKGGSRNAKYRKERSKLPPSKQTPRAAKNR